MTMPTSATRLTESELAIVETLETQAHGVLVARHLRNEERAFLTFLQERKAALVNSIAAKRHFVVGREQFLGQLEAKTEAAHAIAQASIAETAVQAAELAHLRHLAAQTEVAQALVDTFTNLV